MKKDDEELTKAAAQYSKSFVLSCVRNTELENLHSGIAPSTTTGDYSDVKVVTPYGEIPWNEVSRFNDAEMKVLMKDIVNKVYTFMLHQKEKNVQANMIQFGALCTPEWDEPEIDQDFLNGLRLDHPFGKP